MFFIPRVDTLRRITNEEIFIEYEFAGFLEYRYAFIFGYAGINGRFIDHDISFL